MTKVDIARVIQQDVGLKHAKSIQLIDSILNKISNTLQSSEDVQISGFGRFSVHEKSARMGRNPRTGEQAEISARRVVTFRPSSSFKQALLENDGQ